MGLKSLFKTVVTRAMRPALLDVVARLERLEHSVSEVKAGTASGPVAGQWRGGLHGHAVDARGRHLPHLTAKYRDELGYWHHLIKHDARNALGGTFEEVYGRWQRDRINELGSFLGLEGGRRLEGWCADRSVVEIGAGPFPSIAVARWKRAVAIDPLADGYTAEDLLPTSCHCDEVIYIAAPGECIPLPSGFADLVVIENCLDHVDQPRDVVREIWRLLRPGGMMWLLVDLMNYSDHLHPNPFSEVTLRALLSSEGFTVVKDRVSDHKSHPQAYGEYRGLLLKPDKTAPAPVAVVVRDAAERGEPAAV